MARRTGMMATALAAALVMLLGVSGAALAAGRAAPRLLSPNHRRVAPGRIRLVLDVPFKPAKHGVFITIATKRRRDRFGHLKFCSSSRCDFVGANHWRGHRYSYVAQFSFPGYWSVTRGRYYWQAHYYTAGDAAVYYSAIGWFVVK